MTDAELDRCYTALCEALGQAGVILGEGFDPGAALDGVSFANPLDPTFDLATLE